MAGTDHQRPPLLVGDLGARVNAQAVVNSRGQVGRADWVGGGIGGAAVGGTVHLAAPNAAAGQHYRVTVRPVIRARARSKALRLAGEDSSSMARREWPSRARVLIVISRAAAARFSRSSKSRRPPSCRPSTSVITERTPPRSSAPLMGRTKGTVNG